MASGLNKRKMIQHAVFKELVKVKVYLACAMIFYTLTALARQIGMYFRILFIVFMEYLSVLKILIEYFLNTKL